MNVKFYEITINSNGYESTYPCTANSIVEAVSQEYEHFVDTSVIITSINEISEERYRTMIIAVHIRNSKTWADCRSDCFNLCIDAGMVNEWVNCDGDESKEICVTLQASDKLNVVIL